VFSSMRASLLGTEKNTNSGFPYGTRIKWDKFHIGHSWLNAGEWCQENFGRPGDVYIRVAEADYMTWWFRSEQDQLVFVLRNGDAQCMNLNSPDYL